MCVCVCVSFQEDSSNLNLLVSTPILDTMDNLILTTVIHCRYYILLPILKLSFWNLESVTERGEALEERCKICEVTNLLLPFW
jgi:hypothetical protein